MTDNSPLSAMNKCRVCGIAGDEIGANLVQGRGGSWQCQKCHDNPHPSELKNVGSRHLYMARMFLTGCSGKQVAKELGLSEGRVSVIRNSPLFEAMFKKMEAALHERVLERITQREVNIRAGITEGAKKGVVVLNDLVADTDVPPGVRAKVAKDFLEMEGHGAVQKTARVSLEITGELNAELAETLRQEGAIGNNDELTRELLTDSE